MYDVLASAFKARDQKKFMKRKQQRSNTGKLRRRKTDLEKCTDSHREQMDNAKLGKTYGEDVDLAQATKTAKAKHTVTKRNP